MAKQFKFSNFIPSYDLVTTADITLGCTLARAPTDATTDASIEKVGNEFFCRIVVCSSVGHFAGEFVGAVPQEALREAMQRLNGSLKNWRARKTVAVTHAGAAA